MITHTQCFEKFGDPVKEKGMTLWDVPTELELGVIPKKIYCNKMMVVPLSTAFKNIIDRDLIKQLKTWDGCFNIRSKKGGITHSLHSWGMAIDINASWNGFGVKPIMSAELVKCFTDAGFEWGGVWKKPDGMHFQLKSFGV